LAISTSAAALVQQDIDHGTTANPLSISWFGSEVLSAVCRIFRYFDGDSQS